MGTDMGAGVYWFLGVTGMFGCVVGDILRNGVIIFADFGYLLMINHMVVDCRFGHKSEETTIGMRAPGAGPVMSKGAVCVLAKKLADEGTTGTGN